MNGTRKLLRSRDDRMIAGICGGLAEWLGWDATLVRIAYVVISILSAGFPGKFRDLMAMRSWKTTAFDAAGTVTVPNGSIGFRWGTGERADAGRWNLAGRARQLNLPEKGAVPLLFFSKLTRLCAAACWGGGPGRPAGRKGPPCVRDRREAPATGPSCPS